MEDSSNFLSFSTEESEFIELVCFKGFAFVEEQKQVPIKKFIIIFYIYLQLLFGKKAFITDSGKGMNKFSIDKKQWMMKDSQYQWWNLDRKPRFLLPKNNPVEAFYKRIMAAEMPI